MITLEKLLLIRGTRILTPCGYNLQDFLFSKYFCILSRNVFFCLMKIYPVFVFLNRLLL